MLVVEAAFDEDEAADGLAGAAEGGDPPPVPGLVVITRLTSFAPSVPTKVAQLECPQPISEYP